MSKAYFSRAQLAAFGHYNTSPIDWNMATNEGATFNYMTNGVGCSVVELDCLTGSLSVLRTDIVMDVGRSINPAIDIGQVEGAFVQGLGYMTMEELLHCKDTGRMMNRNTSSYNIPTVKDIPR